MKKKFAVNVDLGDEDESEEPALEIRRPQSNEQQIRKELGWDKISNSERLKKIFKILEEQRNPQE